MPLEELVQLEETREGAPEVDVLHVEHHRARPRPLRHGSMIARAPRASRLTAPARRTKSDSVVESYETLTHQIGPLLAVLLVAFVCGAALGLERELRRKAAGLKTIVLICIGSAIYAALARLMLADAGGQADPTRVAGQVITGVGFIGGGAILQAGGTIMGLTSAAVIWTAAGIGPVGLVVKGSQRGGVGVRDVR